ncbi:MAG: dipeptidase, partial [Bacilli bacterium]
IQTFAIYTPERVQRGGRLQVALQMIDIMYERILKNESQVGLIRSKNDLERMGQDTKPHVLLSLEGADALQGELANLRLFYKLGLRSLGLTWNYSNEAADGALEPRAAGLTQFGKNLVTECRRLGIIVDVSHLTEKGFYDVAELGDEPFIASHSNCRAICEHPRNLTDEQIKTIVNQKGGIGVTFVREFLNGDKNEVSMNDLLRHIDHLCSLGAVDHIGIGSDFDGCFPVEGMEHGGKFGDLSDFLLKHYSESQVKGFMGENWLNVYKSILK